MIFYSLASAPGLFSELSIRGKKHGTFSRSVFQFIEIIEFWRSLGDCNSLMISNGYG